MLVPPYSQDINPVEFLWRKIKRKVSVRFIQSKEHLRNIIKTKFIKVGNHYQFAKKWIEALNVQIKSVIYWGRTIFRKFR